MDAGLGNPRRQSPGVSKGQLQRFLCRKMSSVVHTFNHAVIFPGKRLLLFYLEDSDLQKPDISPV